MEGRWRSRIPDTGFFPPIPGLEELRKSFTEWVLKVLLPSRVRGLRFSEDLDLEEVKAMLAESGFSWSDRWERDGEERATQKAREALLGRLEKRFGPLPEEVRRRVEAVASIEEVTDLSFRAGAASSLAELTNGW